MCLFCKPLVAHLIPKDSGFAYHLQVDLAMVWQIATFETRPSTSPPLCPERSCPTQHVRTWRHMRCTLTAPQDLLRRGKMAECSEFDAGSRWAPPVAPRVKAVTVPRLGLPLSHIDIVYNHLKLCLETQRLLPTYRSRGVEAVVAESVYSSAR